MKGKQIQVTKSMNGGRLDLIATPHQRELIIISGQAQKKISGTKGFTISEGSRTNRNRKLASSIDYLYS